MNKRYLLAVLLAFSCSLSASEADGNTSDGSSGSSRSGSIGSIAVVQDGKIQKKQYRKTLPIAVPTPGHSFLKRRTRDEIPGSPLRNSQVFDEVAASLVAQELKDASGDGN